MWSFDDPNNRSYIKWDWFGGGGSEGGGGSPLSALMGGSMGIPSLSSSSKATGGMAGPAESGDFFGNVYYQDKDWQDHLSTALPWLVVAGVAWILLRKK